MIRNVSPTGNTSSTSSTPLLGMLGLGEINDGGGGILESLKAGRRRDGWSASASASAANVSANANANLGRNFSTRHFRTYQSRSIPCVLHWARERDENFHDTGK
jgi:hypothetical protein